MTKLEYKMVSLDLGLKSWSEERLLEQNKAELDLIGSDGWEAVSANAGPDSKSPQIIVVMQRVKVDPLIKIVREEQKAIVGL